MGKVAVSKLADSPQTYPTREAAVIAALRNVKDKHTETGGGILYDPDSKTYSYTEPVGQADGYHFAANIQMPAKYKLQGLYHTHPSGPSSTYFSQDDIDQAGQLSVPSYILTYGDNKIRRFDPGQSAVIKYPGGNRSLGSEVDEAPPQAAEAAAAAPPPLGLNVDPKTLFPPSTQ